MTLLPLLFSLIILIASAKLGGLIAYRLRQPAVLGELLVGLLLGPSLIDLLHQTPLLTPTLPGFLEETLFDLAELGVILLMFLAGLEVEIKEMLKRRAWPCSPGPWVLSCPCFQAFWLA